MVTDGEGPGEAVIEGQIVLRIEPNCLVFGGTFGAIDLLRQIISVKSFRRTNPSLSGSLSIRLGFSKFISR